MVLAGRRSRRDGDGWRGSRRPGEAMGLPLGVMSGARRREESFARTGTARASQCGGERGRQSTSGRWRRERSGRRAWIDLVFDSRGYPTASRRRWPVKRWI